MHYIGHDVGLYDALSPINNLTFRANCRNHFISAQDIEERLSIWRISHLAHQPCANLSYGQKKKVAFAGLSHEHPIWLLDEPTNGLDARSITHLESLCNTHREQGGIVLISAHQWALAKKPSHTLTLHPWEAP